MKILELTEEEAEFLRSAAFSFKLRHEVGLQNDQIVPFLDEDPFTRKEWRINNIIAMDSILAKLEKS